MLGKLFHINDASLSYQGGKREIFLPLFQFCRCKMHIIRQFSQRIHHALPASLLLKMKIHRNSCHMHRLTWVEEECWLAGQGCERGGKSDWCGWVRRRTAVLNTPLTRPIPPHPSSPLCPSFHLLLNTPNPQHPLFSSFSVYASDTCHPLNRHRALTAHTHTHFLSYWQITLMVL